MSDTSASDVPFRFVLGSRRQRGDERDTPSCLSFSRPDGVISVGSRSRTTGGGHFVFCSALGSF